jgi:hypothetical protein
VSGLPNRTVRFGSSNSAASFVKFQNRLFTPLGDIKGLLMLIATPLCLCCVIHAPKPCIQWGDGRRCGPTAVGAGQGDAVMAAGA